RVVPELLAGLGRLAHRADVPRVVDERLLADLEDPGPVPLGPRRAGTEPDRLVLGPDESADLRRIVAELLPLDAPERRPKQLFVGRELARPLVHFDGIFEVLFQRGVVAILEEGLGFIEIRSRGHQDEPSETETGGWAVTFVDRENDPPRGDDAGD